MLSAGLQQTLARAVVRVACAVALRLGTRLPNSIGRMLHILEETTSSSLDLAQFSFGLPDGKIVAEEGTNDATDLLRSVIQEAAASQQYLLNIPAIVAPYGTFLPRNPQT